MAAVVSPADPPYGNRVRRPSAVPSCAGGAAPTGAATCPTAGARPMRLRVRTGAPRAGDPSLVPAGTRSDQSTALRDLIVTVCSARMVHCVSLRDEGEQLKARVAAGAAVFGLMLAGCGAGTPGTASTSALLSATTAVNPSLTTTTVAPTTTPGTAVAPTMTVVVTTTVTPPPSTTSAATSGQTQASSPVAVGQLNHTLTPGHVFAAATSEQICVSGYSAGVRDVTTSTRAAVFAAYRIAYPPPSGAYELDHLIPLELGGDNSSANLWPEPYHGVGSADVKDHLENHLHDLVCAGQVELAIAQQAVADDWMAAAARYNPISVTPVPAQPAAPASTTQAPTTTDAVTPPVDSGGSHTAMCRDGSYSDAVHHKGACSGHGGVAVFYK